MPILGEAEFIEHQFNDNRKTVEIEKEQILMIIRNAKRLNRLASDILDVAKIESRSLKLEKERFNLNEVICSAVRDLTNYIANTNNSNNNSLLRILYKPIDIIVEGDKERILQVTTNLLSNALKFTEEGYISISTEKKGKDVIVTIKDTGRGIDQEIQSRLFSKFVTKSEKGTGLGLYISKNIIERHGGKIWAENNPDGKGATFAFSIPLNSYQ